MKNYKKILSVVLALVLAFSGIAVPAEVKAAELTNLALGKTAVADSQEANSVKASNAVDGNTTSKSSRWGSGTQGAPHWIYVDLGESKTVQSVRILWEQRKPTAYRIQASDDANSWTDLKVISKRPAELDDVIVLDKAVETRYVRLYIDSYTAEDPDGGTTWSSVSIFEMEVYNGVYEKPVAPKDAISVITPEKGDKKLEVNIPESDDFTITYNGTDYEQVVDADLNIYQPIVDTTVKVSFKIVDNASGDYEFKEIEVTVPGFYTQEEGDNEPPAVIPELREWKGGQGTFEVTDNAKVIIGSADLKEVADVFAEDYKEITGKELTVVEGSGADLVPGDYFFVGLPKSAPEVLDEMYRLEIADVVVVESTTTTGAFWATRTILQALKSGNNTMPQGITRDYPLYEVRGYILDVGRKTFTLDYLEDVVKQMAWYKLNDFHVHLNDNYIFLENYTSSGRDPMTAYSGFRLESDIKAGDKVTLNGKEFTYSADLTSKDVYYTKDEFRNFIKTSDVYGVNIVPELDAPAHSLAFTKVLPELRTGTNGRQNDHLDLAKQYDESFDFITNVFDEYLLGEDPVFTEDTVVHIGADEYEAAPNKFREFCNDMADYVESTGRTARIWGSLSQIRGDGSVKVDGTGIQMNLWNFGYANMDEMYESGFGLIDCNDGQYYIVPNAGYYGEYLSANVMYNDAPNSISGVTIPAGDKQMLGAAYAVWNDMIDEKDNGVSEYDVYKRFVNNMGLFAAKMWGKGSLSMKDAQAIEATMGNAPGTDFEYEVEVDENYAVIDWTEEEVAALAKDGVNVSEEAIDGGVALKLNGGASYVTTGLETVGLDKELTVMVQRTSDSTEDQVLFESAYGSIKAVQGSTGKVGITRENFDYSFNYELPVGAWVELTIKNSFETVSLYVNGELVDTLGDDETIAGRPMIATCMLPVAKIGSETNAFEGYVANMSIKAEDPKNKPDYDGYDLPTEGIKVTAGSLEPSEGSLGALLDGDPDSFYHSNWSGTRPTADDFWITLELPEVTEISGLRYLPRQSSANGRVLSYVISYSVDGSEWTEIAVGDWADNSSWKLADFGTTVEAKYVKLFATDSKADGSGRHLTGAELRVVGVRESVEEPPVEEVNEVARISGTTRYETGYKVADALKETLGVDKFDAVVVATGKNFADALAGSYLAIEKNAPIILTNGKDDNIATLHAYIAENVVAGGTVYILGGEGAVPAEAAAIDGYDVVRLAGKSRYETNLAILNEAGINTNEIVVATGKSFADSLSASALGLPILLVKPGESLNDEQKEILKDMDTVGIIGGTGAVSEAVEAELTEICEVVRISGKSRYETSVALAEHVFGNLENVVVASGKNFPDGLCGGPLAAAMGAPLILTADGKTEAAAGYMAANGIASGYVLGGSGALADESVVEIFALENADEIVMK